MGECRVPSNQGFVGHTVRGHICDAAPDGLSVGPLGPAAPTAAIMSSTPSPIRLVYADNSDVYRRGMQAAIALATDIDLVAEATSGEEAIDTCRELQPDVVILEIGMPGMSGIAACRAITRMRSSPRIVILTESEDEDDLRASIRAGAMGYLLKDLPIQQVAESVRLAHGGQSVISSRMTHLVVSAHARPSRRALHKVLAGGDLTDREVEVLRLVGEGKSNPRIANELSLSPHTVKNHVRNITKKLGTRSRVELATFAARR